MRVVYFALGAVALLAAGVAVASTMSKPEGVAGSDPDATSLDTLPDNTDTGAPTPEDIEGAARMLASEAPSRHYTLAERVAILWCAINVANARRKSIASIMLPPHHQKGFWCSTIEAPNADDTVLATAVLNGGQYSDPTNGATSFFEPAEQDRDFAQGLAGVTRDADAIRAKWTGKDGLTLSAVIGRWEFYKRA